MLYIRNQFPCKRKNIYERDWINFDQENLILDYFEEDLNSIIKKEQATVNLSFQIFLTKIKFILDKYDPLKKVSGYFKTWSSYPIGVPHLCTYWCTLVLWFMDKVKIFFQCIAYVLLILNSIMHWLKYTHCKMSINRT